MHNIYIDRMLYKYTLVNWTLTPSSKDCRLFHMALAAENSQLGAEERPKHRWKYRAEKCPRAFSWSHGLSIIIYDFVFSHIGWFQIVGLDVYRLWNRGNWHRNHWCLLVAILALMGKTSDVSAAELLEWLPLTIIDRSNIPAAVRWYTHIYIYMSLKWGFQHQLQLFLGL